MIKDPGVSVYSGFFLTGIFPYLLMYWLIGSMKRFWWVYLLSFILALSCFVYYTYPEPPLAELEAARKALHDAQINQSQTFAGQLHHDAKHSYDSALKCWREENDRIWFRRDFTKVALLANKARLGALSAAKSSSDNQKMISDKLYSLLKQLNVDCDYFDATFKHIPLPASLPKLALKAKLLLSEAELAMERGDLNLANQKADMSHSLITKVLKEGGEYVKDYFDDYARWKFHFERVLQQGRNSGAYSIVVDKFAFCCYLYKGGKEVARYDAEFGKNWIGDKQYQGDKATPEGIYSVVKKKGAGNTIYHRALLLNYPNDEDRQRFSQAQKAGRISKNAKIGGLIEIHGHGGQGANWTEGCVALSNDDMESLFSKVSVGTPVVIVGSLKSFDELFLRKP